jgi:hypothetical protein
MNRSTTRSVNRHSLAYPRNLLPEASNQCVMAKRPKSSLRPPASRRSLADGPDPCDNRGAVLKAVTERFPSGNRARRWERSYDRRHPDSGVD